MKKSAQRFWDELSNSVDRPWYLLVLCALAAADIFVSFIPTDSLLVSSSAVRPKRWVSLAFAVVLGNCLGAAALCAILILDANWITQHFPALFQSDLWIKIDTFLESYGLWTLWIAAVTPLPILPVLVGTTLAGVPFLNLMLVFLSSRIFKFGLLSWLASHSPKVLKKISRWVVD